jgi:hypothetical protein
MDQEVKATEATEQQTEAKPEVFGKEDVAKMMDELNRTWQGRFDKVLTEKKQVGEKAATVEERIAQIEAERQRERIDWARQSAKAKAGIDDELEAAIKLYADSDPESIATGAAKIAELWKGKEAGYKVKIDELEKKLQFGAKAPASGPTSGGMTLEHFNSLPARERSEYLAKGGKIEG